MPTLPMLSPAAMPVAVPGGTLARRTPFRAQSPVATMTLTFFERYGMGIILLVLLGFGGLIGYEKVRDNNLKVGLLAAIQKGDAEQVKKCLEGGADPNLITTELVSKPSVGRLLQCTLPDEIRKKNGPRTSALMMAALSKHAYLLTLLLDRGADVNLRDEYGCTALTLAIAEGRLDMAQMLLERGADPNLPNDSQVPMLSWALMLREGPIARALLDKKADPNAPDGNGMPPLYLACMDDDAPDVRALLDKGAKPDTTYKGWSVLRLSVEQDNPEVVRALLDKGADANEKLADGRTLLQMATEDKRLRVLPLLQRTAFHAVTNSIKVTSARKHP